MQLFGWHAAVVWTSGTLSAHSPPVVVCDLNSRRYQATGLVGCRDPALCKLATCTTGCRAEHMPAQESRFEDAWPKCCSTSVRQGDSPTSKRESPILSPPHVAPFQGRPALCEARRRMSAGHGAHGCRHSTVSMLLMADLFRFMGP